jgi:hypothetical protein
LLIALSPPEKLTEFIELYVTIGMLSSVLAHVATDLA